jgi:hypothetical protein
MGQNETSTRPGRDSSGQDLTPFREGELWGYRDREGRIRIPASFESTGSFSEGLARVRVTRLWGYIDADGRMAIAPQFEQARVFAGGLAKVKRDGEWMMIDRVGSCVEKVEADSYLDDAGRFVSEQEYHAWEKPDRKAGDGRTGDER